VFSRGVDASRAQFSSRGVGGRINQAGEPRLVGLESVRGMAAIVVVWTHAWTLSRDFAGTTYPQRLADGGLYAIFVFFALSGYLLYWPFAQAAWGNRGAVSLRNYALNRAWRVLPAYYVALAVILLLQYHGGSVRLWFSFATFTEDFSGKTLGLVDAPMWSVATEMQFYILLPLIAWGIAKVSRGSLRSGAIALVVIALPTLLARELIRYGLPLNDNLQYLDNTLLETFCYFALGMALAMWRLSVQQRRPKWLDGPLGHSRVWLGGALVLWLIACYDFNWEIVGGLASMLLVGAVVMPLRHGWSIVPFRWRWMALLGVISYSIYLWHFPIMVAISNRSLTNPNEVIGRGLSELFVLGFALSVAVGALSYWQIERRGLARRRPWSANVVSAPTETTSSPVPEAAETSAPAEVPPAAPSLTHG
jgi:peptidoglycan/LPS O-acetylase OafA/YrhL